MEAQRARGQNRNSATGISISSLEVQAFIDLFIIYLASDVITCIVFYFILFFCLARNLVIQTSTLIPKKNLFR